MRMNTFTDKKSGIVISSNNSQVGNDFLASFVRASQEYDEKEDEWVKTLRLSGVKAAHPDDGWVNRTKNCFQFSYPQFNDGVSVGDLVALGHHDAYCIVRVIEVEKSKFSLTDCDMSEYKFEVVRKR
jgi:hypothetical protein